MSEAGARPGEERAAGAKDWNAEWARLSEQGGPVRDAAFWDRRAPQFRGGAEDSPYIAGFRRYMGARPGESILDVGCGTGALALPLARAGHHVTGLDFSRAMLDVLERRAEEKGLPNVATVLAAWDDDWRAVGVPQADVVIASRSLGVHDLRAAFEKLTAHARRRVCVTLPEDGLFYGQLLAHAAVGRPLSPRGDRKTAVGVLGQMGVEPEVRLLTHASADGHETRAAALDALRSRVDPADESERRMLERYAAEHLVAVPDGDGRVVWRLEPPVAVRWAFLAWDKAGP